MVAECASFSGTVCCGGVSLRVVGAAFGPGLKELDEATDELKLLSGFCCGTLSLRLGGGSAFVRCFEAGEDAGLGDWWRCCCIMPACSFTA